MYILHLDNISPARPTLQDQNDNHFFMQLLLQSKSILFVDMFYFSYRNQPEVTQYLLSKGAKKNAVNQGHCSCLHVAVNKSYTECVRILLRHKCDVNLQVSVDYWAIP